MWMYKEDIDLSYRLRWLGEKIALFPEVWAWHARTVANREGRSLLALRKADAQKRDYGRLHSYKNHILLLKNNFSLRYGPVVFARVFFYEFLKAVYLLFRSPRILWQGLKTLFFVPADRSKRRVRPRAVLSLFD
ncbi:MAG: hypothetical protein WC777_02630 [Candidatus Gracilibacteria bacterium]